PFSVPAPQKLLPLADTERNGHHAALSLYLPQRAAAYGHHLCGVLECECAGGVCGCDLSLGMTDHRRGLHPTRLPQLRQRNHHSKQSRLHHINTLERRSPRHTPQHILERPIDMTRQRLTTRTHTPRKHRRTIKQTPRHTLPLRTLTRKNKDDARGLCARTTAHNAWCRASL